MEQLVVLDPLEFIIRVLFKYILNVFHFYFILTKRRQLMGHHEYYVTNKDRSVKIVFIHFGMLILIRRSNLK